MAIDAQALAERGQRLGLRLIALAGGLPVLADPAVRERVGRVLRSGTTASVGAQQAVGRAFARRAAADDPARLPAPRPGSLFDLTPSEDQELLRRAAAELADEVIRPAGAQADTDRAVPEVVRVVADDMGLVLLGVPTGLGGIAEERSSVSAVLVLEELARGDLGIAVGLMASGAVASALAAYGSAEQQATYLPHFTDGAPVAAALALQEPQPLFDPLAPRTLATASGGDLVLSGTKALVPGAESDELFVVSALVDGEPRLVVVEAATGGVRHEDDPAMGLRAARTGRLVLDDVRVPRTQLLGTTGDHVDAVRRSRLAWGAVACGTAQAVLDQVIPYTRERTAFGEPVAHRQAVAFTVADIGIELAGLRLATWRAAARIDAGLDAARDVALVRSLTARHGASIGSHAVQLLGGHGFVKEHDNERWYRDLRGAGVVEGMLLA